MWVATFRDEWNGKIKIVECKTLRNLQGVIKSLTEDDFELIKLEVK